MDPADLQKLQHFDSVLQGLQSGQCSVQDAEATLADFQALLEEAACF